MATGYEQIMVEVLARMKAAPLMVQKAGNIRRSHRTAVPREDGDSVHVIDGNDDQKKGSACQREGEFTISIVKRTDLGPEAVDPLKREVMRRLNPILNPWPDGVVLEPRGVRPDTEIADADANHVEMEFYVCYPVVDEWSL